MIADTQNVYQKDGELLMTTCASWVTLCNDVIGTYEVFDMPEKAEEYKRELQKYKCFDC